MKLENAKIKENKGFDRIESLNSSTRVSIGTDTSYGEYLKLKTDELIPFRGQARKEIDPDEIQKLAETIREHGIRQPLTVELSKINEDKYEIISGERRWQAAKLLNLERVPCIVLNAAENAEEIALIENIQRKDLTQIELAQAIKNLFEKGNYPSQEHLCRKIGMSKSKVSELLSFANLPAETQKIAIEQGYSRDRLREMVSFSKNNPQELQQSSQWPMRRASTRKPVLVRVSINKGAIEVFHSQTNFLGKDQLDELKQQLQKIIDSL